MTFESLSPAEECRNKSASQEVSHNHESWVEVLYKLAPSLHQENSVMVTRDTSCKLDEKFYAARHKESRSFASLYIAKAHDLLELLYRKKQECASENTQAKDRTKSLHDGEAGNSSLLVDQPVVASGCASSDWHVYVVAGLLGAIEYHLTSCICCVGAFSHALGSRIFMKLIEGDIFAKDNMCNLSSTMKSLTSTVNHDEWRKQISVALMRLEKIRSLSIKATVSSNIPLVSLPCPRAVCWEDALVTEPA